MRKLTLGKIYKNGIQYSGTTDAATNINYDNSKGAIKAGNVQGAIDEIMETTSQSRNLTQAEYDALPDTKYTDGIEYFITDAEPLDASTIAYDNTASKMTATNVQAGIDELNGKLNKFVTEKVELGSDVILNKSSTFTITFNAAKEGYIPIAVCSWALYNRDAAQYTHVNGIEVGTGINTGYVYIQGRYSNSSATGRIPANAYVVVLYQAQ